MKKAIQLEEDVRGVLAAAEVEGNVLRLVGQLDRKLYERTNKALEALGGAWNRKLRGHVFSGDPRAAIAAAVEDGKVPHPNGHDFFRTQYSVAVLACTRLSYEPGMRLLEPSVGEGDLVAPLLDLYGTPCVGDWVLYEKDPRRFEVLERKKLGDFLVRGDFLEARPTEKLFDRVIENPPFHNGADAIHIAHSLGFVAPGGRLVAIASAGLKSRENKTTKALRDKLAAWGASFEDLPDGSFRESGTDVSTILITVVRPAKG